MLPLFFAFMSENESSTPSLLRKDDDGFALSSQGLFRQCLMSDDTEERERCEV